MTLKMLIASLLMHLMADIFQAHAIEEPAPEVFLQPRNFNPHPYELGYDPRSGDRQISRLGEYANQIDVFGSDDRGPILFPANNEADDNRVTTDPYVVAHLKDTHPYAGVAAKKKKKYGRILEQVNPQIYNALAAHGAKVLSVPRANDLKNIPNYVQHYDYNDETKKNYAFSYKVVDHLTGDDFSHSQSQNSHATNGEYRVKLPDGRVQIVSYTADKNGYKADVKYSGSKHTEVEPTHHHRFAPPQAHQHLSPAALPVPIQIEAPGASAYSTRPLHVPLYADSVLQEHVGGNPRDDGVTKSHAHDFINQHLITDEHKPAYYQARDDPGVLFILSDKYRATAAAEKVQLLPNIRAQKVHEHGKFIAATLAPYIVANDGGAPRLHDVQALSTLAPDLDKFNPVYIDAPKYKLPTTIH